MKKFISLSITAVIFGLLITSCHKDSKDDEDDLKPDNSLDSVFYEGVCSDPINYQIGILYSYKDEIISDTVESPFKLQFADKSKSKFLYLSVMPIPRVEGYNGAKTATAKLYINNKLHESDTDKVSASVEHFLGIDPIDK